jgi:hypothetical protein
MTKLLAIAAALLLATGTAHATADGCAVVLRTPDGFLNVRAKPNARSRILKRLKPGERIGIDLVDETLRWERVFDVFPGKPYPNQGWVRNRFIIDVSCDYNNTEDAHK